MHYRIAFVLSGLLLIGGFLPSTASASEWGCKVLLCLSTGQRPSECSPPLDRLWDHLEDGGSFPSCSMANGGGNNANASMQRVRAEACPAGYRRVTYRIQRRSPYLRPRLDSKCRAESTRVTEVTLGAGQIGYGGGSPYNRVPRRERVRRALEANVPGHVHSYTYLDNNRYRVRYSHEYDIKDFRYGAYQIDVTVNGQTQNTVYFSPYGGGRIEATEPDQLWRQ